MAGESGFKLHDIVETVKGAKFWGEIIAFDSDPERPGCTVMAIAPDFAGTKHVYPLAQLRLRKTTGASLFANDAVWAAFYRDDATLGQIAEHYGVSIYALSPWLTAPIVRSALAAAEPGLRGAISVAARAHEGQVDKAGRPYFAHPLRMVARALADCHDPEVAIVAALHDVIEDSAITIGDLRGVGFSERVVDAVEALTRRAGESYRDFLLRLRPNDLARRVKLFDLDDNTDPLRLALISDVDNQKRLVDKYTMARCLLDEEA
jgi:hypothetical protein